MFSALKSKLTSSPSASNAGGGANASSDKNDTESSNHHGINSMNAALQRKFAKGVNYNLKLLLRGDRNTGKSCLFKRLQGGSFIESYTPSDEISVASIQWNYKATDDIVKVEVWDVVDKGKKRKQLEGLKLAQGELPNFEQPALDAEFVDVYKGAHGVIIMFDVTKAWTFDYVKREAPKVPKHIPILVLANFIDQAHHRAVTRAQAVGFIEDELDRGENAGEARYAESSMRNGFGLKFLHKFLNLPFLTLQKECILGQLETNKREMRATLQELDLYLESDDANYDTFASGVTKRRRAQAESLAPKPTVDVVVGQPSNVLKDPKYTSSPSPTSTTTVNEISPPSKDPKKPGKDSSPVKTVVTAMIPKSPSKNGNLDMDNFIPDTGTLDNFLDDDIVSSNMDKLTVNVDTHGDDISEDEVENPMVASFAEEVEIEDYSAGSADVLRVDDAGGGGIGTTDNAYLSSSSEDQETVISRVPTSAPKSKATLKAKLSNTSSKSDELHFELPEHLMRSSEVEVDKKDQVFSTTDNLDSGDGVVSTKNKKHHKKGKKSKKSKKEKSEDQVLEEFLNGGPANAIQPEDGTYEEL